MILPVGESPTWPKVTPSPPKTSGHFCLRLPPSTPSILRASAGPVPSSVVEYPASNAFRVTALLEHPGDGFILSAITSWRYSAPRGADTAHGLIADSINRGWAPGTAQTNVRGDRTVSDRRKRDASDSTARQEREGARSVTDTTLVSVDGSSDEPEFQVDKQALRQRAVELLEEWESAGRLDRIRSRTRTVTAAALGVFVVSGILSGSTTGITSTVASVWLTLSGAVAVTVGAIALLLRGLRRPREVADKQGALALLAISLLAVGGTHYGRYPASRAAWRYLVTGPLRDGVQTDGVASAGGVVGRESRRDAFPLHQYVRLAGGISAAVVVIHQGWLALQGRDTVLSSLVRSLVGSGSGVVSGTGGTATDLGTQLTAFESVAVLLGVVVLGVVIGALLAVGRSR